MKNILPFLLLISLAVLISCSEDELTKPTNSAPKIESVSASPSRIKVNEITFLSCVATDADGDSLSYSWSADEGSFPQGSVGASVAWRSPSVLGNYEIIVIVSDGKEIAEKKISIDTEQLSTKISGKVFDRETKEPLSGVRIMVDSQVVFSDTSGFYQFLNFSQGTYNITAEMENYFLFEGEVILSSGEITFDISMDYRIADIYGIVKDSYTGEIIKNVKVSLNGEEYITDQTGYYEFLNLVKGAYTIRADDNTYKYPLYDEHILISSKNQNYNVLLQNVCEGKTKVTYAGKIYNTVQIDDQCWLKENLNIGKMISSYNPEDDQTDNGIIEKYCYNNDTSNCNIYGGLYQWSEAMQYQKGEGSQGICPTGWHIPTYAELQSLRNVVDGSSNDLKAIGEGSDTGVGTDKSGFTALLGGNRNHQAGTFNHIHLRNRFWSSVEYNPNWPYMMSLRDYNDIIYFDDDYIARGYSIRCLKN